MASNSGNEYYFIFAGGVILAFIAGLLVQRYILSQCVGVGSNNALATAQALLTAPKRDTVILRDSSGKIEGILER